MRTIISLLPQGYDNDDRRERGRPAVVAVSNESGWRSNGRLLREDSPILILRRSAFSSVERGERGR